MPTQCRVLWLLETLPSSGEHSVFPASAQGPPEPHATTPPTPEPEGELSVLSFTKGETEAHTKPVICLPQLFSSGGNSGPQGTRTVSRPQASLVVTCQWGAASCL